MGADRVVDASCPPRTPGRLTAKPHLGAVAQTAQHYRLRTFAGILRLFPYRGATRTITAPCAGTVTLKWSVNVPRSA